MKKTLTLALILVFTLCITQTSFAQTRRDVRTFTNFNRFLKRAIPQIENAQARRSAFSSIEGEKDRLQELLKWNSNSGALYRVKARIHMMSGAVEYSPIENLGFGSSPLFVLAKSYNEPGVTNEPNPSVMMRPSQAKSFYIWITNKRNFLNRRGVVFNYGLIDQYFYKDLNVQALSVVSNIDVQRSFEFNNKISIINGVFETLEIEMNDAEAFNNFYALKNKYLEQTEKIDQLTIDLENDLSEIQRASKAQNTLNTMGNILSLANLSLQIAAATNINQEEIDGATSVKDLKLVVERTIKKLDNNTVLIRNKLDAHRVELIKSQDQLKAKFQENDVPAKLIIDILH
ncbi:hypothetical protein [Leeuwenhoekiella marinoflava]|uniref:TolC family protein n=2 Tax=Leeuwenhoekiella marinoflava TaxID=988 RepID=A0A4Q0PLS3_9FLAO|nr:hypothetical protein [Leeuwenhoekiella marinoflava]RXG29923.1 hypothetical protein DSL99_1978 [Leeuwenhoekiella marinoflava]SHF26173.1 hypothetical protein SAMN02745246_02059 [Leeuwenhoekiella marinoflava DSM 3653]